MRPRPLALSLCCIAAALLTTACSDATSGDVPPVDTDPASEAGASEDPDAAADDPETSDVAEDDTYAPEDDTYAPEDDTYAADVTEDGGPELPAVWEGPAPDWSSCTAYDGTAAECATASLPRHWDDPTSATTDVFVKRVLVEGAQGQLWVLPGGPGTSESLYEERYLTLLGTLLPLLSERPLDLYFFERRGVGSSTHLACPGAEDPETPLGAGIAEEELADCAEEALTGYGDDLAMFSTTNVARDLDWFIEQSRGDADVFVLGISYGTFLAHRYLQLRPDGVDGVVMDGVCPPGRCMSWHDAEHWTTTLQDLMVACGEDAFCASKLGPDPWARVEALFAALEDGHCASVVDAGFTPSFLAENWRQWLISPANWAIIPALISRFERCEPADEAALLAYFEPAFASWYSPSAPDPHRSAVTFRLVTASEGVVWDPDFTTVADAEAELAATYVTPTAYPWAVVAQHFPAYEVDTELAEAWAVTDVPILWLNGQIDAKTPIQGAREAAAKLGGACQQLVEFPRRAHNILRTSLTGGGSITCGLELMADFIADPCATLDTSCTEQMPAIDWDPPGMGWVFGLGGLWDD